MKDFFASREEKSGGGSGEKAPLADGELIRCMCLEYQLPKKYTDDIAKKNSALQKEAEENGWTPEVLIPNAKDGGLQLNIAIVLRSSPASDVNPCEYVFHDDIQPEFRAFQSIISYPPRHVRDNSYLFDNCKGGGNDKIGFGPKIIDFLPNPFPAKDFKTGINFADIKGKEEMYPDLVKAESERIAEWNEVIAMYDNFTEEEALNWHKSMIARRLLICRENNDGTFTYWNPSIGQTFQLAVSRNDKGFLKFVPFAWSKSVKKFVYTSKFDTEKASEEDIAFAENLLELREKWRNPHKEELEKEQANIPDGDPF